MTLEAVFLTLLNRSLAAAFLVLALLLLRPFLRRVSRSLCCALWGLVAFRLLCPFSFQSVLSLLPSAQPISVELAEASGSASAAAPSFSSAQVLTKLGAAVWMLGFLALVLFAVISYLRLCRRVREAVKQEGGYWLCDWVDFPFVLGFFRPRILLPFTVEEKDIPYILAHERAHLARRDHWRKPIAYALLAVFWFQPVLWLAYFLLRRDVEFACDERALRRLGMDDKNKALYARALLRASSPQAHAVKLSCPLAFGGLQVRRRVQSVLKYRKPAVSLLLVAMILCSAVSVCFLTDPKIDALPPVDAADEERVLAAESSDPAEELPEQPAEEPVEQPEEQLVEQPMVKPSGVSVVRDNHYVIDRDRELTAQEHAINYEIFSHRIQTGYTWEPYVSHKGEVHELPAEIAEKYGTTEYEELPDILIYENIGTKDSTETLYVIYYRKDENGRVRIAKTETLTIEIPAGEVVYYPVDPGIEDLYSMYFAIIGGSYGDLSVEYQGTITPPYM